MSQTTLLEEVSQWSPETCRHELKAVLPKLVSLHHKTNSWEEHINILQLIINRFLPHLPLSELEDDCFSKVLPKAEVMFTSLLDEISKQIGGLSSQNTDLQAFLRKILQVMVQTLEALSACVRHVCSFEEPTSLDTIRTLPSCVLHLLKDTFQHCKESEVVYSGKLSLVGDLLQALFKEAYSLQKGLMELLEKVNMENSQCTQEIFDIVTVLHSLLDICSVISSLDIALHANTWKFIIKQSVKYQSSVEERIRHGDITFSLSADLLASLCSSLELAEQVQQAGLQDAVTRPEYKLFQKTTKMCRFFTNTLVHYIKEFKPFLSKSCGHFYQFCLQILSKFPPSLSAPSVPSGLAEELSGAVLVPMDALLTQLLPMRPFAECALAPSSQESSAELALSRCLLLVSVMGKLSSQPEDVLCLWCDGSQFPEETPRLSIFEAALLSFRQSPVERAVPVRLPGVMLHGQAQGKVSLHQHVCVHLCGFVASLPAQHFPSLERSLLGSVLQSDTPTAVLATDVWCFLARYGTAELCLHHVLLTAHLIKSCPSEGYHLAHLGLLLRRLLFLMTPNHQMEFVERFAASWDDLCILHPILLRSLCPQARSHLEGQVRNATTTALDSWHSSGCRLGSVDTLNKLLAVLLVVVREEPLQAERTESALKMIGQLWSRMLSSQVQVHPSLQCTLKLLLSISAPVVKSLEPQLIVQAFSCLSGLDVQKCPDDLLLAVLEFLTSLGKVFIPSDIQPQVLPRLAALFSALLSHDNRLLHQHALEAFSVFAEATNHEEVISQCLTSEVIKNKVVNFLSKVVAGQEAEDVRVQRLRAEANVINTHNERLEREENTPVHTAEAEEPRAKRPRHDNSVEEELERHLQTAESALRALQAAAAASHSASSHPPWLTTRLQDLQSLIAHISNPTVSKP